MIWPKHAEPNPTDTACVCPFVDVGVGVMQHGVDPECPVCNPHHERECSCADWRPVSPGSWGATPWAGKVRPLILDHLNYRRMTLVALPYGYEIDPGCPHHGE